MASKKNRNKQKGVSHKDKSHKKKLGIGTAPYFISSNDLKVERYSCACGCNDTILPILDSDSFKKIAGRWFNAQPVWVYWQSPDKADFGYVHEGAVVLRDGYEVCWSLLEQLRVFTPERELHIWKAGGKHYGRVLCSYRSEVGVSAEVAGTSALTDAEVLLQASLLRGSRATKVAVGIDVTEDRGSHIWLPTVWSDDYEQGINVFIVEHVLYQPNDDGFLKLVDRRFVELQAHLGGEPRTLEVSVDA
ncbi:MAG: hypothetical protein LBD25_03560 [Coriobacteriales bacterium]|jgi:hypothetical protein|nr:hypothetical protein [Coriobacteriales bacterium]